MRKHDHINILLSCCLKIWPYTFYYLCKSIITKSWKNFNCMLNNWNVNILKPVLQVFLFKTDNKYAKINEKNVNTFSARKTASLGYHLHIVLCRNVCVEKKKKCRWKYWWCNVIRVQSDLYKLNVNQK